MRQFRWTHFNGPVQCFWEGQYANSMLIEECTNAPYIYLHVRDAQGLAATTHHHNHHHYHHYYNHHHHRQHHQRRGRWKQHASRPGHRLATLWKVAGYSWLSSTLLALQTGLSVARQPLRSGPERHAIASGFKTWWSPSNLATWWSRTSLPIWWSQLYLPLPPACQRLCCERDHSGQLICPIKRSGIISMHSSIMRRDNFSTYQK